LCLERALIDEARSGLMLSSLACVEQLFRSSISRA